MTPPPFSRGVAVVAAATGVLLLALSGRYGFHRDELYFLACGRHLAWGYPDQPPFVPFLAHVMSSLSASLVVLRLPSDVAVAATVLLTGLISRELGGERRVQLVAAAAIAIGNVTLASGHLLSTTTFGLTAWSALLLLFLRILRTCRSRLWPIAGVVAGVGLLDNDLVVFLVAAVLLSVLLGGPRRRLADPWLAVGVAIAATLWAPYLIWQAHHGWPQLDVASAIAGGSSGSGAPRWAIPVQQLFLVAPLVTPVWVAGLVRLLRDPELRWARSVGVAWLVLLGAFVVTGGKPYYLALAAPVLLGAGAAPTVRWLERRRTATRAVFAAAFALSAVVDVVVTLPVVPADALHRTPIVTMNYDAGETVGWPAYVDEIAVAWHRLGDRTAAVMTSNYGEAGAVDRYGASRGLPAAFGVHNGYWLWGPPKPSTRTVLAVGFDRAELSSAFADVVSIGRLHNPDGVENDEQGAPLWRCSGLRAPWPTIWRELRHYG